MIMESDELYLSILLYAGAPPDCNKVQRKWIDLKALFKMYPTPTKVSDPWIEWYAAFRRAFGLKHPEAEEQDYTDHAVKFANWCRQRAAAQRIHERRIKRAKRRTKYVDIPLPTGSGDSLDND